VIISMVAEGIESPPITLNFETPLAPPQDLTIDFVSHEEVVLSWEESSSSVTKYRVRFIEKANKSLEPGFAPGLGLAPGLAPEMDRNTGDTIIEHFIEDISIRLSKLKPNTEFEVEVAAKASFILVDANEIAISIMLEFEPSKMKLH